jgi:hypothetical protein
LLTFDQAKKQAPAMLADPMRGEDPAFRRDRKCSDELA